MNKICLLKWNQDAFRCLNCRVLQEFPGMCLLGFLVEVIGCYGSLQFWRSLMIGHWLCRMGSWQLQMVGVLMDTHLRTRGGAINEMRPLKWNQDAFRCRNCRVSRKSPEFVFWDFWMKLLSANDLRSFGGVF
ncbi:hypothetical protein CEXT_479541 [Caerostris extrusa]|uniref:Uncharacterized protein n=1 Tax=Caerostris extrusa TaxID=172846 RepID=A0AAV4MKT2_CAEEX|nr:hypothetical protein CEXT_479541 [Caerostris extrusa]